MTKKTWLIFAVVCVALIAGVVWLSQGNKVNVDDVDLNTIQSASERNGNIGEHILGKPDAKVKIIEYGDFQCPGCKQAAPVVKEIQKKYPNDVAIIFRNFPLVTIHPNARAAAAAAEAVALQNKDKYWEIFTILYENQTTWSSLSAADRSETFASYVTQLGLDRDRFLTDVSSKDIARKIDFDAALGRKANVTGTPTFFVNGEEVTQYAKDGKLAGKNDGSPVWNTAENFEKFVIVPALQKAGVDVEKAAAKTDSTPSQ